MSYQLCIPPYFTNVLRAFGTIEGIALKVDPGYSIVQVRATLGWEVQHPFPNLTWDGLPSSCRSACPTSRAAC